MSTSKPGAYSEPWTAARSGFEVCDLHESQRPGCSTLIADYVDVRYAHRIIECVNEMRGLNPQAVREVVEKVEALLESDFVIDSEIIDSIRAALAKVRPA